MGQCGVRKPIRYFKLDKGAEDPGYNISYHDELNYNNILQCDGANSTILSSSVFCDNSENEANYRIPVVSITTRARKPARQHTQQILKQIQRNPRINASSSLPVVAVANVRSLLPKVNSFIEKMKNESIQLCLIVEVWEKQGRKNKHFQAKTEEMMEMHGYKYISCGARSSGKRGGGAAILADLKTFTIENLSINVPNNLEVIWALVRPKNIIQGTKYAEIIVGSFYSAPNSRKNKLLLDHLVSTTHALMARWPRAAVVLGGDRNELPISPLLQALPRFRQIVAHPTHGIKTIDVIITSCPDLYCVPEISDPVLPDNPQRAKPSDHKVPVARPLAATNESVVNVYEEKVFRPLPDSGKHEFMKWVHSNVWDCVSENDSPTEQFESFEKLVQEKVDFFLQEKKIRVTKKDKEYITAELKNLDRKKKREWSKNGKSQKYISLKSDFDQKLKKAASQFITKCVTDLRTEHPGRAAATLKRLGGQPGDCEEGGTFTLQNHIDENLSVEEQLERFGDYFSAVSQEFPPLELGQLSDITRKKLSDIRPSDIPKVEEYEIHRIIEQLKRKKSSVPGDMPPRLFYEASVGLAVPGARMMNKIAQTGIWPEQLRTEWGVPLEKKKQAKDESETRLISCTNKMNVVFEKQVIKWIMDHVQHRLDPDQLGGLKGSSISHYLIEMTNFILYNQDLKDPLATLATMIDYKQGFNRCQHSIFIEIMSKDYNIPGWLLNILVGYLTKRKLRIKYKSKISREWDIYGRGGQGCPLGFWIFCFMIDQAGPRANQEALGKTITRPIKQRQRIEKTKKKWVDDFSVLASIDLKKHLEIDPNPVQPVPRRGRHHQILPQHHNILQDEISEIVRYSKDRNMLLNQSKTKAMIFNPLLRYDVLPQISIGNEEYLEVVDEHKILGQIIRSDLKTISNTENICTKAFKRMWILRRLKALGCPTQELLTVLREQIISICEVAVAWWGPMITKQESNMLERILKTGLHIIFQDKYLNFTNALKLGQLKSLKERRIIQITKFSKKAYQNPRYKTWFCESDTQQPPVVETRSSHKSAPLLKPVTCRTQRYSRSSIPLMTSILAWHPPLRYRPIDLA